MKQNQPCFDKNGEFLGWFSRSVAVVAFVFCKNKKEQWCVLGSVRGKGTPDPELIGKWNCVCGYVDFNETLKDAAVREVHEETGLHLTTDDFELEGINDDPKSDKRQNITCHYVTIMHDVDAEDFRFTHKYNEKDEVDEIKFIPLNDIKNYEWAFGHEKLIRKYAKIYDLI